MLEDVGTAVARTWVSPFWPTCGLLLVSAVYLRGWLSVRLTRPRERPGLRAVCFGGGLLSLWLVIASPLDALGNLLLTAHMAQHFILMSVTPPLILLGAPTVPLLRGLPKTLMREIVAPWSSTGWINKIGDIVSHPAVGWILMNAAYVGWHLPASYELALRSSSWHEVEHGCFFFTSLSFWWTVIQPWPSHARFTRWLVIPYLLGAGIINTALSASFAFSGHVFYPTYTQVPRLFGLSALSDQITAGVGMWGIGDIFFLGPVMLIAFSLLGGLPELIRRSESNLRAVVDWQRSSTWCDFLAQRPETRSCTSICLRIVDQAIAALNAEQQAKFVKELAGFVETEGVGYDIASYRDAPSGLRIWGGATVETSDIEALLSWLDYAFATPISPL